MVTLLTIDGGGIRGLLPARVLQDIEQRLRGAGDTATLARHFDLIAGTSTGALIALGTALAGRNGTERYTASDIVELYLRRGKEIFPHALGATVHTAVQAFHNKYAAAGLEGLLHEVFGNAPLSSATTNLLITSFDTEAMRPHCMKHRPTHGGQEAAFDYYMRDAARASTAAPTYFPPARISPIGSPEIKFSLIDGGVFANNPSGLAYVETTKIFPEERDFLILSLGTGNEHHGYGYHEIHSWGYVEWVNPVKGFPLGAIVSAGQSEAVIHQLSRMAGVRYIRIDAALRGCNTSIDDSSRKNLDCLNRIADKMIAANETQIEEVCRLLASSRSDSKTVADDAEVHSKQLSQRPV